MNSAIGDMKTLLMVITCFFVACAQSQHGHNRAVTSTYFAPKHIRLPAPHPSTKPVLDMPKPDTRSPEQIAHAACLGADGQWGCRLANKILGAGENQPIFPPSWTVANWYVDPSNSSGCASDSNSGTSATCSAGGVGPLLTFGELQVHRWGCIGNPSACPRIRQNTTITLLSSQSGTTDPFYLKPALEAGARVSFVGTPTQVCTGTISGLVALNRSTHQLLTATLCTGSGLHDLVVNTTRNSRAFPYTNVSGTTYTLSQPYPTFTIPWAGTDPHEDHTWANGDAITVYSLPSVYLADVEPVQASVNGENAVYIGDVSTIDGSSMTVVGDAVLMYESTFGSYVMINNRSPVTSTIAFECESQKIVQTAVCPSYFQGPGWQAGIIRQSYLSSGSLGMIGGVIMNGTGLIDYSAQVDDVYVESGTNLNIGGDSAAETHVSETAPYVWGPGQLSVFGYFLINANTAAPTLLISTVMVDGLTTGCSMANSATPGLACGIAFTGANIDSHNGYMFNPTGQSIVTLSGVF